MRKTKIRLFSALFFPLLLYDCEIWNVEARDSGRLNYFSTRAFCRILGYRWDNFFTNERVLLGNGLRRVTYIIRKRQLRLFGHVARFPESGPVNKVISEEICPAESCRELMVIAVSWDWQEGCMHGTPLEETPRAGTGVCSH